MNSAIRRNASYCLGKIRMTNAQYEPNTAVKNGESKTDVATAFPDEIAHLAEVNDKLENALREADASVDRLDREYTDIKLYMVQNRGEIDPHEMFQNELALKRVDHAGVFAVHARDKIVRLKDSPYFARIDFMTNTDQDASAYYIGRYGFSHKNQMLIFDWRAPIAGMFYDCEVGPAGYDAPLGRVEGQLARKRQFHIKQGVMEYVLESSMNIQDDILQRELSHTSDEKMKSIIATIQKEQNQIIRNETSSTLIIQGVAGSGKTSIALHRIAYLLYSLKGSLSAANVMIISPNQVFADYISNVLPELGEEPICEWSFTDIAEAQLEGIIAFEPEQDPMEAEAAQWAERARFKSSLSFLQLLDQYLLQMPHQVFKASSYTYGQFTANADWIQARYDAYSNFPVKQRLQKIAEDICERFETDNFMGDDLPKPRTISKSLGGMLRAKNSIALYKEFFAQIGVPGMFVMPGKKTLEWADVFPFLYLHAAFEGLRTDQSIRHLVIDEMQDYTPVQYAVLNQLFQCRKTILGDFGQHIHPYHSHTLQDLQLLFADAELVMLNKSYRSTYEIIHFARRIQSIATLEAIERHGEKPVLIRCRNKQDELRALQEKIKAFFDSRNATLGIIMKTNRQARELFESLSQSSDVHLIAPESARFANGVSITSVQMSKGLEFDEVIIPSADDVTYVSEYDRRLLYIACTRAMHRLTLTYTGQPTKLIDDDIAI